MVLAFIEVGIFLTIMGGLFAWNFLRGDDEYVAYMPKRPKTKPVVRKLDHCPYDWARADDWR